MLFLLIFGKCYQAITLINLLWSSEGLILSSSYYTTPSEKLDSFILKNSDSATHTSDYAPSRSSQIPSTLFSPRSSLASRFSEIFSRTVSTTNSFDPTNSFIDTIAPSSVTFDLNFLSSSSSSPLLNHISINSFRSDVSFISSSSPTDPLPSSMTGPASTNGIYHSSNYMSEGLTDVSSSISGKITDLNVFSHFHTPLMSLLVATSSKSWNAESSLATFTFNNPAQSLTTSSSDNELSNPNHLPVPTDSDHKKLLMLVLRAEDCAKFSKSDFERMLGKLMAKFGFNDVTPEVSNAKCYSHLNINVTVGGPTPTLRFLSNVDSKNNFTVDVLNRTFRIVKLEKVDLKLEKTKSANNSSSIIAAVANHESVAYIAVGVSFGLILVICLSVCCIKCCCLRKPPKRYVMPKGAHVRLRPEDYTLTPIPRPTSLYVDYYRGSGTADIYSTTSAGSIASTTPTVEQGVVQPFDTSIVPLEDSSNLPLDSSRDPSVESVPVQSDLKTFNIHSLSGKGLRTVSTDSKEQLNPKAQNRKVEIKPSGVANPTFQRY